MKKKVVPKLRQEVKIKVDIVTSDDIKIYYTGKFQDFTARYIKKIQYLTTALGTIFFSSVIMVSVFRPAGLGSSATRSLHFCYAFVELFLCYVLFSFAIQKTSLRCKVLKFLVYKNFSLMQFTKIISALKYTKGISAL